MKVQIECIYCGHLCVKNLFTRASLATEVCEKCKDKNIKVTDLDGTKIDYYKGSPPFPEKAPKIEKSSDDDYLWYGH